jgi:hypothetical protein
MLSHVNSVFLRGLLMADEVPSGDRAVFAFLELVALAFMFEGVSAFLSGKSLWTLSGCALAALFFFVLGIAWPRIKLKVKPSIAFALNRIANDSRYRIGAALIIAGYVGISVLLSLHALRSDLEKYVLPRVVTPEQSVRLRNYLSHHEAYSVVVKYSQSDQEALDFAAQISDAIRQTGWKVTFVSDDKPSGGGGQGMGIYVEEPGQSTEPDPRHPKPHEILLQAFGEAGINVDQTISTNRPSYAFVVMVTHRPLALGTYEPPLHYRVAKWLMRMSW